MLVEQGRGIQGTFAQPTVSANNFCASHGDPRAKIRAMHPRAQSALTQDQYITDVSSIVFRTLLTQLA